MTGSCLADDRAKGTCKRLGLNGLNYNVTALSSITLRTETMIISGLFKVTMEKYRQKYRHSLTAAPEKEEP